VTKQKPNENPEVDAYLANSEKWPAVCARLRSVMLECGLSEALKWQKPCYAHAGNNIAIIQEFKEFAALMFFKGALLNDTHGLLESQGENSRSAMRVCFTRAAQVHEHRAALRDYVQQAIRVEQLGLSVPKSDKLELAQELAARLRTDSELRHAFEALTPGRQRAYNLYVSGAKQSSTRASRVEACVPRILALKGLRD
jgi:uncharacterized protein YdeI (YjbR/CyaY-like superfamily)